ncbi:MAG: NUDIX domain-containing protein [Leifsonia sp.]
MRTILPPQAVLVPPEADLVFQGVVFSTYQWQQKTFDGSYQTFEMLRRADTVQVIAVKDDAIVILHERQPGGPWYYSMPGGRHDRESETELGAARRELLEETGLIFSEWKLLEVTQPHPKIEHFVYVFLASGFERATTPTPDNGEQIHTRFLRLSTVKVLATRPDARGIPTRILDRVGSIDALLQLPALHPSI